MSFFEQIDLLQQDTLLSLKLFLPELALCGSIVALLVLRIMFRRISAALLALLGTSLACALAICDSAIVCCGSQEAVYDLFGGQRTSAEIFTGMLVVDSFTIYFRTFLSSFAVLFVLFTWRSGIPDKEDGPDFYTLALGALLGMMLMSSANHLLMVFVAVEMASVPSFVLSGILKGRRQSSEAALKFAIYGAGAAGVMLYGISLLAGVIGSAHIPTAARDLAVVLLEDPAGTTLTVLSLGGLMVMVGLAFKLSAVPFHFWAPDVFEGAAAEIGGFLSVASKAAALALLVRVSVGFGYVGDEPAPDQAALAPQTHYVALQDPVAAPTDAETPAPTDDPTTPETVESEAPQPGEAKSSAKFALDPRPSAAVANEALRPVRNFISLLVALLAAITATWGNLAAYGQTNIKRLLAYSTIAHAGYMMMPVAAAMVLSSAEAEAALASIAFYVVMYLFMNLGAFATVAFLRNRIHSEAIDDYAGLLGEAPGLVVCFGVILMSLLGIPPLAGFAAKFAVFSSLADAGLWVLFGVAGANTALSLFYYIRVLKVMTIDPAPEGRPPVRLPALASLDGLFVLVLSLPLVALGVYWQPIYDWASRAAAGLLS